MKGIIPDGYISINHFSNFTSECSLRGVAGNTQFFKRNLLYINCYQHQFSEHYSLKQWNITMLPMFQKHQNYIPSMITGISVNLWPCWAIFCWLNELFSLVWSPWVCNFPLRLRRDKKPAHNRAIPLTSCHVKYDYFSRFTYSNVNHTFNLVINKAINFKKFT